MICTVTGLTGSSQSRGLYCARPMSGLLVFACTIVKPVLGYTQPLLLCVSQEWLCGENVLETRRGCGPVPEICGLAQQRRRVRLLPRMFSPSHFNQCSHALLALQSARDISPLNNGSRQWSRSR